MSNLQDEEFNTFGITKTLRKGLVIGIISILFVVIVYLFYALQNTTKAQINLQEKMYERLLEQQNRTLQGPVNRMNNAAKRTDEVVSKVDSVANNTDSLNNVLRQNLNRK